MTKMTVFWIKKYGDAESSRLEIVGQGRIEMIRFFSRFPRSWMFYLLMSLFAFLPSVDFGQSSKPKRVVWKGIEHFERSYNHPGRVSPASGEANDFHYSFDMEFTYVEETDAQGRSRWISRKVSWKGEGKSEVLGVYRFECRGGDSVDLEGSSAAEQREHFKVSCKYESLVIHFGYFPATPTPTGTEYLNPPKIVSWDKLRDDCSYSEERPGYSYSVWVSPEIDAVMEVKADRGSEYWNFVPEPGKPIKFSVKSNKPALFKFEFKEEDVSHFSGYATNADVDDACLYRWGLGHLRGTYKNDGPDLILDPKNHATKAWKQPVGWSSMETVIEGTSATVTVTAMDFGAYGKLRAYVRGKCGGWEPVRILVGEKEREFVKIPMDEDDNLIADRLDEEKGYRGDPGRDDDAEPKGDGTPGDGLTAFEEYRGFMTMGNPDCKDSSEDEHVRTDPAQKDLFIHSDDPLLLQIATGLTHSSRGEKDSKGIKVHPICERHFVSKGKDSRIVNFTLQRNGPKEWQGKTLSQDQPQRGLYLRDGSLEEGKIGHTRGDTGLGPPRYVWDVTIDKDKIFSLIYRVERGLSYIQLLHTVIHELGHAVGIDHHGYDIDEDMDPHNIAQGILVVTDEPCPEDAITKFYNFDPVGKNVCVAYYLARRHAHNSGNQDCPMRYEFWRFYETESNPLKRAGGISFETDGERHNAIAYSGHIRNYRKDLDYPGIGRYCSNPTGTGINALPGDQNHAGDSCRVCYPQIRINDIPPPPKTPRPCINAGPG
jgi:hypothetical protein